MEAATWAATAASIAVTMAATTTKNVFKAKNVKLELSGKFIGDPSKL